METRPRIEFQGMTPSQAVTRLVDEKIDALEKRFGRATSCRVVIRGPGDHHRTGGLYDVSIRLSLPGGREVHVTRTSDLDERYADVAFAVNDAFKRARRQLQDHVRKLAGQVKSHEATPIGTVSRIDKSRGYGFLTTADGHDVYFHRNSVLNDGFDHLAVGMRVAYAEEMGKDGPQASTVKRLGKHGLR